MQDYHRGLILGGQTFGKGTVQTIQPLNHGELKLTLAQFYRVSGPEHPASGRDSRHFLPADVDTKEIGESALPEALPWDSIRAAISGHEPVQTVPGRAEGTSRSPYRREPRLRLHP